ncbi:MAG: glycosyltransferase [Erysipelotrichaceae bacterium]|nr:glycosyltransferase [Erysipelotrichaceae bacterium]
MITYVSTFLDYVMYFFIAYLIGYASFQIISVIVGAYELNSSKRLQYLRGVLSENAYIPVSILVPAHNEGMTVCDTVYSLLNLDYSLFEIVVVNDGSTDDTAESLIKEFNLIETRRPIRIQLPCKDVVSVYETKVGRINLTLINKVNGGKADALNMGINASRFPYFVCMDADSLLQKDSIYRIVQPILTDSNVVAVGGSVRPCNDSIIEKGVVKKIKIPKNLIAAMQVIEYDRTFLATRILFDKFNGSMIISGAFGLFKKDIVIQAGGYNAGTVGEDMELVLRLHEYCAVNQTSYRIKYATDAICWTQAPEKLSDLCKQRRRWHLGLRQSMASHRRLFASQEFGLLSVISYTYFLLYELYTPVIEMFGLFTVILAYCFELLNVRYMIFFTLFYTLYGVVISNTAFFSRTQTTDLEANLFDHVRAFFISILEIIFLRPVLSFVRMRALFSNINNTKWGKIQRKKFTK